MPKMKVRHPETGQTAVVQWKDGEPTPSPEHIKGLFITAPEVTATAPRPTSGELGRNIATMTQDESTRLFGGMSPEAARSSVPGVEMRRQALGGRTEDQIASGEMPPGPEQILTNPVLNPMSAGVFSLNQTIPQGIERFKRGAGQFSRAWDRKAVPDDVIRAAFDPSTPEWEKRQALAEIGTLTGPFGISVSQPGAYSSRHSDIDTQGDPNDTFTTGLVNMAAGLLHPALGLGASLTPTGAMISSGMNLAGAAAPEAVETVMSPAEKFKLFGESEAGRGLNELADIGLQGAVLHKAGKWRRGATEAAPTPVEGGAKSTVIPGVPIEAIRKVPELMKLASRMRDKNNVEELNKTFDTNVKYDGEAFPGTGLQQYTVYDKTIPPDRATFTVNTKKGETLADNFINRTEKFAAGEYKNALKGEPTPQPPASKLSPRTRDAYGAQLQASAAPGLEALESTYRKLQARLEKKYGTPLRTKYPKADQQKLDQLERQIFVTGRAIEDPTALNAKIAQMQRGKEIPFWMDKSGAVGIGKPGETHFSSAGKNSGAFPVRGRIDEGGKIIGVWGEMSDFPPQKLTDTLFELLVQGKVKKDAIVYFSDGKYLKLKDAIGGGEMKMSAFPGLEDVVKKIKESTIANGGATFDPRTGEDRAGKPGASVSPYPERSLVIPGKDVTEQQIAEFVKKNEDVLAKPDHMVGTWYDKKSGQTYVDVSIVRPRAEAVELGMQPEINQKAVFDLEKFEEVPTGGTGERVPGAKPFDYDAYLQQRAARQQKMQEQPLWKQQFEQSDRQVETGHKIVDYITKELGLPVLGKDVDASAKVQRLVDMYAPEIENILKTWDEYTTRTGIKRKPWYGGLAEAKQVLAKYHPELKDPAVAKLFGWMTNVHGNGNSPLVEFLNGLATFEQYKKTGKIEFPASEEAYSGVRDETVIAQLHTLQGLVDKLGIEGAVKWLEEKHPVAEVEAMKNKLRPAKGQKTEALVSPEYGPKQPIEGAYIFGPKLGAYGLNKEGISGPVTLDSWENIMQMLLMGEVKTKPSKATGQPELVKTNVVTQRRIGREAKQRVAQQLKITPEDVQALDWVYIIRPFFEKHGQDLLEGGSHGDFANWLDESGWLARRVRGEGATLAEARTLAEQRGLRQRTQEGPEALRAKPRDAGDAYEGEGGDTDFPAGPERGPK